MGLNRTRSASGAVAIAALVVAFAHAAFGQGYLPSGPWVASIETPLKSHITPELIAQIEDQLQLSDKEREGLSVLAVAHSEAFGAFTVRANPLVAEWNARIKRVPYNPAEGRFKALAEREATLAPLADEQAKLDRNFLDAVPAVLEEPTRAKWPGLRESIERRQLSRIASMSREASVDVSWLYDQLLAEWKKRGEASDGIDQQAIDPVLRAYEPSYLAGLRKLAERQIRVVRTKEREAARRMVSGNGTAWIGPDPNDLAGRKDDEEAKDLAKVSSDLRLANRRTTSTVANLLPVKLGNEFRYRFVLTALSQGRALGFGSVDVLAGKVLGLETIDADQRTRITDCVERWRVRAVAQGSKALQELAVIEELGLVSSGGDKPRSRDEVMADLEIAAKTAREEILGCLTPEQASEAKQRLATVK